MSHVKLLTSSIRDLSALSGYYKGYVNGTYTPPRLYVYDVLPSYNECLSNNEAKLQNYKIAYKHGGEVYFVEQASNSPWRTLDPEEADLFVIPLLPGFILKHKVCIGEAKDSLQWIQQKRSFVESPNKHVLLTTHFVAEHITIDQWCPQCIHFHQDNIFVAPNRKARHWAVTLSAPMHGQLYRSTASSSPLTPFRTQQLRYQTIDEFLNTRSHLFYFAGQADDRKAYKGRRQVQKVWEILNAKQAERRNKTSFLELVDNKNVDQGDFTFIISHQNPKSSGKNSIPFRPRMYNFTEDVATTRFGYQGRGDNPTSSRLYEWIDVGAIPVIVIDDAWLPGLHIPWKDFTITVKESLDDEALAREFERIAYGLSREELDAKRTLLRQYAPSLLWAAPDSVVAEMLLIDAWDVFQALNQNITREELGHKFGYIGM